MSNLFLRLYLVLIIAFVGLGVSIDAYFDGIEANHNATSDIELHKGTLFLLAKELKRLPENEREQYLKILSPSFGFPVKLVNADSLVLSPAQKEYLDQAGIVSIYHDELGQSWFYQKLDYDQQTIALGPIMTEPTKANNLVINLLFFIGLAFIVFIWAWPISKGLKKLTTAATAFGQGDFTARASLNTAAPLVALVNHFNGMAGRIQRLIKSHKELSHAVSHELRTPIARIRFAMEMVREIDDKTQQHKYLSTMDDNIEELDGLVDELLTYARFDREEPDLNIAKNDITAVAQQAIDKFTMTHQQLEMRCINLMEKPITAYFDSDAIERALDNLIRNACRYAKHKIHVYVGVEQNKVKLMVDDDGPGIPEADRQQLFDPFVRLDQSRDRNSGGIGLGLAMVKRLIELHQGQASVSTAELGGARFILTWPVRD